MTFVSDGFKVNGLSKWFLSINSATEYLPSSSTCVNLLKMPPYESEELLEQKLREALTANTFEKT